jgi:hypothetical protein
LIICIKQEKCNINSLSLFFKSSDNSILQRILTQKIQHLNIDVTNVSGLTPSSAISNIFRLILFICQRLINLNFCQLFHDRKNTICIYTFPLTSCTSSTLIKLKVNAATFDDCLCILDGRLKCLSTLIIHVDHILLYSSNRNKVTII